MNRSEQFRPGQRVRIRLYADSEFAGYAGTVVFVGTRVCDVRIRYRPKGAKGISTYIGTFRHEDLESLKRRMDLAYFTQPPDARGRPSLWGLGVSVVLIVVVVGLLIWQ